MLKDETLKLLIEAADSFDDADSIIAEYKPDMSISQKLSLLCDTYDVFIVGASEECTDAQKRLEADYEAVLTAIVDRKWR